MRNRLLTSWLFLVLAVPSAAGAQQTDILFVVDETGSMAAEIGTLQSNALSVIAPAAQAALGDVAFGVAAYRDFPVSPFGDPGDQPYQVKSGISTNSVQLLVGLNALSAGGGGDFDESGLYALHTAATVSPGWRGGAARVIFWIGDAGAHDGDLEPGYGSCCSDVGLGDASAALATAGIAVYAFSIGTPGLDGTGQATAIAAATSGAVASGLSAPQLTTEIVAVIQGPLSPPVIDFTADPAIIGLGGTSTLSWFVTDADSCDGSTFWPGAKDPVSGSKDVLPTVTSAYILTCDGPGGQSESQLTVTVPEPGATLSMAAALATLGVVRRWRRKGCA
jgi:hypothetical protein